MPDQSAILNLSQLLHQGVELKTQGELNEIELNESENWKGIKFSTPVQWKLSINPVGGDDFWLSGAIKGTIILECSRCLTPVEINIEAKLSNVIHYDSSHRGMELTYDETGEIATFGQVRINFMPFFAENFMLNVPLSVVCQPDCRGLCLECGINLNNITFSQEKDIDFISECPEKRPNCPNTMQNKLKNTRKPFEELGKIELE